ncbi:MAG: putative metal-binding motif-containing protein [Lewinellaceae bacterium]|nr:putative metal-binding motif-containing protein [Lewinellaceae bacterium]
MCTPNGIARLLPQRSCSSHVYLLKFFSILFWLPAFILLPATAVKAQFAIPICTTSLQITNVGGSGIVCNPNPCNWSWSGTPGLTFSCGNCQFTNITAAAPGAYTAVLSFSGSSNGSLTYSLFFGAVDADNDTFLNCDDCNDNNAAINPNTVWYKDFDNDGYSTGATVTQCEQPAGYKLASQLTATSGDCDDNNPTTYPNAPELCNGIDDNCDAMIPVNENDADGDGFRGCQGDCNDNNAAINPNTVWYRDVDNDGYSNGMTLTQCAQPNGYKLASQLTATSGDCDDNNAALNPLTVWYKDADNDGYSNGMTLTQCAQPSGYKLASQLSATTGDCNDNNNSIHPNATETCNGIDDNCDNQIDEGNICCPAGNVLYVKASAAGADNGSSWTDAYDDLQDALAKAGQCANITEIWVAAGTYKPTAGMDRNASFYMINNVAIYGGFPGLPGQEGNFSVRNWVSNASILSGDIGVTGDNSDNSYNVVYNAYTALTNSAILDGFTITGGYTDGDGSGGNKQSWGGGLLNELAGSPLIRNCQFTGNTGTYGSAGFACLFNGSPKIINCIFKGNSSSNFGGAVVTVAGGTAIITNCTFYGNSAPIGCIVSQDVPITISNSIIWGNSGGILFPGAPVTHSIVQGGYLGTGNLNVDPLFVNAPAGDLHLQACSPAINAGTNTGAPTTDLDNNMRPFGGTTDMGAYEFLGAQPVPVASCKPYAAALNAAGQVTILPANVDNGSTYGCSGLQSMAVAPNQFSCANIGANIVTLTVTANDGSTATCTATVNVNDPVPPTATCQNVTVELNGSGMGSITTAAVNNNSADACGIQGMVLSKTSFDCSNVGANTVTLTVTDNNTNTATCTATVTVNDNVPPTASCQNVTVELNGSGMGSTTASAVNNGSSDACGIQGMVLSKTSFDCSNVGGNTVMLTVTDNNTNTATCTATVTVNDNVPPTASCQNVTVELNGSGMGSTTAAAVNNGSADACGIQGYGFEQNRF